MRWIAGPLFLIPFFSASQVTVANIFSDNMVLQRNQPIRIWGKALPGKKVVVQFPYQTKTAVAKKDSSWIISFRSQAVNRTSQTLTVTSGDSTIRLNNILIGDVWVASGQSNMEWPMNKELHWKDERKRAAQPLVRFANPPPAGRLVFGVAYTDSLTRRLTPDSFYLWNGWKTCDSNTLKSMSAVSYYVAKSIVENTGVPIGIINLSIGGAPIETFISKEALQQHKRFSSKVKGAWLQNENLPQWIRERALQNLGNNPKGYQDDLGLNHAYKPGFAFESGIKPLLPMPITGLIWYQGESNGQEIERVNEYVELMKLMVDDYRKQWQCDFPFYFVQLSSIDTTNYKGQLWPQFRDEQRKALQLIANSGMAVSSDAGAKNDVHPTNKKVVGERLARWALFKTYKKDIVPSGPLPVSAEYKGGKIIVHFAYEKGLTTADQKPLRGFSTDGKTEADARIEEDKVIVVADTKPRFIYYGWKPYTDANLVNAERLPASTFKIRMK